MDFLAGINWENVILGLINYFIGYGVGTYFAKKQAKNFYLDLINRLPDTMKNQLYTELGKENLEKNGD